MSKKIIQFETVYKCGQRRHKCLCACVYFTCKAHFNNLVELGCVTHMRGDSREIERGEILREFNSCAFVDSTVGCWLGRQLLGLLVHLSMSGFVVAAAAAVVTLVAAVAGALFFPCRCSCSSMSLLVVAVVPVQHDRVGFDSDSGRN